MGDWCAAAGGTIPICMKNMDDDYVRQVALNLAGFVDRYRDDLPEVLWTASLTMIDRATERTREWRWWRAHPDAELRRLRERLAEALSLARYAAALQEAENGAEHDLERDLREHAAEVGRAARRAQTLPAERARLAKKRRDGVPATNFHLAADYPAHGAEPVV